MSQAWRLSRRGRGSSPGCPLWLGPLLATMLVLPGCSGPPPQRAQLPGGDGAPASVPGAGASSGSPVASPAAAPATSGANGAPLDPAAAASPLPPLPAPAPGWPSADLVEAGNIDGEGDDEIVCWSKGRLSIWSPGESAPYEVYGQPAPGEAMIAGIPNLMTIADLDADGRDDILLGYGMTRGQLEVPVTLALLRLKGSAGTHHRVLTTLYQARSPRPQVTGLTVADLEGDSRPEILLAHFDSKYFVTTYVLSLLKGADPLAGVLPARALGQIRMASSFAAGSLEAGKKAEVVVARPYGEDKVAPGDVFVWKGGEQREAIPAMLGVRSVTIGDGDGDHRSEVYFGDGWHFEYGAKARGRLSVAHRGAKGWESELIEDTKGQYEIKKIVIDDVDGDRRPEVIAAGNRYISLYWKTPKGWMVKKLADGEDFAVARLGGVKQLVVPGGPITLVSLKDAREGGRPVEKPAPSDGAGTGDAAQAATPGKARLP